MTDHEHDRLGSIAPGKLADLVGYPIDPRAVHHPGGLLGPSRARS